MTRWSAATAAAIIGLIAAAPAGALDVSPHRALYNMTLESAHGSSGLVGASGTLSYQWADSCDGWTIEQNYDLDMQYEGQQPISIQSNYVTWESKDGRSYRYNQRETRNGEISDDIKGTAQLGGKGGFARFEKPKSQNFALRAGSLFPTAHTLELLRQAQAGHRFFLAHVFDGSTVDGTSTISTVIGPRGAAKPVPGIRSPLLQHPAWQVWMAFFSDATTDTPPDYALEMHLLDDGVSSDMRIDYGDYVLTATLAKIEALPKPSC